MSGKEKHISSLREAIAHFATAPSSILVGGWNEIVQPTPQEARVAARKILALSALAGGQTPHPTWQQNRLADLRIRRVKRIPKRGSHGSHQVGRISLTIYPDTDHARLAATIMHEAVHAALMGDPDPDLKKDSHAPKFWAVFTLCAHELWGYPDILVRDFDLENYLRANPHLIRKTFEETP